MSPIVGISLLGAASPALIAAVAIMLTQPNPRKLMLGFLLGGYTSSMTLGLVVLFALSRGPAEPAAQAAATISPAIEIAVGLIALAVYFALRGGVDAKLADRWHERRPPRDEDGPSSLERRLSDGSPRLAFVAGAIVCFPGAPYFLLLGDLVDLPYGPAGTIAVLIAVNLVLYLLIEIPLLGYLFFPDQTAETVKRFNAWVGRNIRTVLRRGALVFGLLLVLKGVIDLLAAG